MCAVIGYIARSDNATAVRELKSLLLQSQIRGRHATGMAQIINGRIACVSAPVPASQFIEEEFRKFSPHLSIGVAHCRYSTSDLLYNQPIQYDGRVIAHNGVVTQDAPENWPYQTKTKNDSELLLHSEDPLKEFPEASIAAIELRGNKLIAYRNEERPLWVAEAVSGNLYLASTRDILQRSDIEIRSSYKLNAEEIYEIH